jgi:hypothetical protein
MLCVCILVHVYENTWYSLWTLVTAHCTSYFFSSSNKIVRRVRLPLMGVLQCLKYNKLIIIHIPGVTTFIAKSMLGKIKPLLLFVRCDISAPVQAGVNPILLQMRWLSICHMQLFAFLLVVLFLNTTETKFTPNGSIAARGSGPNRLFLLDETALGPSFKGPCFGSPREVSGRGRARSFGGSERLAPHRLAEADAPRASAIRWVSRVPLLHTYLDGVHNVFFLSCVLVGA